MAKTARTWAEVIKERRTLLGLTQIGLAELLDVTQAAVSLWERGEAVPSARHRSLLVQKLGIDPDTLHRLHLGEAA
jgi:transcriptional regulator with XRE-family HTH domain